MPLPELRMLGNAVSAAHDVGKLPEKLLLLSAMMVSLGNAFAPPHSVGRVPSRLLSVSVSSLQKSEGDQDCVSMARWTLTLSHASGM